MTDSNNTNTTDFVSKSDLQVLMATFKQEIAQMQSLHKAEMVEKENQIHSSYAKKLKKFGVEDKAEDEAEDAPSRKFSKREMEMQANVERLVKEIDETKARAKQAEQRTAITDHLIKGGINPKAVDTVYTLLQAKQALVEGEDGILRMKVTVDGGATVPLPVADALKHFVKF